MKKFGFYKTKKKYKEINTSSNAIYKNYFKTYLFV